MVPQVVVALIGVVLVGSALWDAFETVVLPHRVARRWRFARIYYRSTWLPYRAFAHRFKDGPRREAVLSYYGPLSLLLLVALWAGILVLGFASLQWSAGSALTSTDNRGDFWTDLYFSGTTFFTLGLGDVVPAAGQSRLLTVIEGGMGFAFLALLIGYLPIVYQMFARRETNVSLLDQRAGSPPTATELIRRNVEAGDVTELISLLREWEIWVADLLESHMSYPVLAYFRSQHENQSWVGALAVILDVSAYVVACGKSRAVRQASFTFAVGRHAVGDLTNVFALKPREPALERLDQANTPRLLQVATEAGILANPSGHASDRLKSIRKTYEPYLAALDVYLLMDLPPWLPADGAKDNWESTAWDFNSPAELFAPNGPFRVGRKQPPPNSDAPPNGPQHGTGALHPRALRQSGKQPNDP
jgi:Ion channel